MNRSEQVDLHRYLARLMRWSWLIILVAVLSGTGAYIVSNMQEPVYRASTTILIDEAPDVSSDGDYRSILTSERRTQTYALLLTTRPLLEAVIDNLDLSINSGKLKQMVSVESSPETQLIAIHVQDTDKERAAQVANTLVTTFSQQIRQLQATRFGASKDNLKAQLAILETQIQEAGSKLSVLADDSAAQSTRDQLELSLARSQQSYADLLQSFEQIRMAEARTTSSMVHVEPAIAPDSPWFPPTKLFTTIATILGMLLVIGALYIREVLETRMRTPNVGITPALDRGTKETPEFQAVA